MAGTITNAHEWPSELERERSISWMPDFQVTFSPPSLDGTRQGHSLTGGGLWRATYNEVQLRSSVHRKSWMTLEVKLRGGLEPIDVPLLLCRDQPRPQTGNTVIVTSVGAWDARRTDIIVDLENCQELEAGNHFSVYDNTTYGWRLHRIQAVQGASSGGPAAGHRTIFFWPPLRFALANNDELEFDEPRCVMRLESSDSMDMELELRRRGNPSVSFVEAH